MSEASAGLSAAPRTGRVRANGIDFATLEAGPADGPLVLCVHGFPDTPHTWSDVMPRLAAAGYRVVAPFTRGYPPSSAPENGDYSLLALAEDVVALIGALGAERAIIVGHDWGAIACYLAANLAPARVDKLVTVAIPHARALRPSFRVLRALTHFFTLQLPWAAAKARRNDFAYLVGLYRKWSPGWRPTADDLAPMKAAFSAPGGLDAAIAYYRVLVRRALGPRAFRSRKLLRARTGVPTMTFLGTGDPALTPRMFDDSAAAFTGPYQLVRIPDAGHFAHREDPELFARELLAFLAR